MVLVICAVVYEFASEIKKDETHKENTEVKNAPMELNEEDVAPSPSDHSLPNFQK